VAARRAKRRRWSRKRRSVFPTEQQFGEWWAAELRSGRVDGCDYFLLHGHGLPASWKWAPRNRVCPLARYLRVKGRQPNASVGLWAWGTGHPDEELPLPEWAIRAERKFDAELVRGTRGPHRGGSRLWEVVAGDGVEARRCGDHEPGTGRQS